MPIADVDDEGLCNRPAVVIKQADSRSKDFTGDSDNELVAG
jgi:hypothetical protein